MNESQENVGKRGDGTLKVLLTLRGALAAAACVINRPVFRQSVDYYYIINPVLIENGQ